MSVLVLSLFAVMFTALFALAALVITSASHLGHFCRI